MKNKNDNSLEKKFTFKERLYTYLKGLVIATVINCSVGGVFLAVGHFAFHAELSFASYSNAMFMVAIIYMLYGNAVFQGDLNARLDSSNLEYTPIRFDKNGGIQSIRDKFSRGESIMIVGSYILVTLGISYLLAII